MAFIDIKQFGGVTPRLPPRDLDANGAQVNANLLATAVEFRPLLDDQAVSASASYVGARTLYRLSRNVDGSYRADDAQGWIVVAEGRSYAKGDLHDDATERTFVSFNDGARRPRVIDATGQDRLLGVPAPAAIDVALGEVGQFTMDDALAWWDGTALTYLTNALFGSLAEQHVTNGRPTAGADAMYCLTLHPTDGRFGNAGVPLDQSWLLQDPGVGGYQSGNTWVVPIECLPLWGIVNRAALVSVLLQMPVPQAASSGDGSATAGQGGAMGTLTQEQAEMFANAIASIFDPDDASLANLRQQMTTVVKDFCDAIGANFGSGAPAAPVKPDTPSVSRIMVNPQDKWSGGLYWPNYRPQVLQQYPPQANPYALEYVVWGDGMYGGSGGYFDRYEWWLYNKLLNAYNQNVGQYQQQASQAASDAASRIARIVQNKAQAASLHDQIYGEYQRRIASLQDLIAQALGGQTLFGDGGIIKTDADRVIDTRFYVATHVNDWGWESAPSPVSAMIECDQNDTVSITIPHPPQDRQITKWRIYRSNVGTQDAAYQFVAEVIAADGLTFVDTVKGQALGEPCPTFGWLEPPYRPDNNSAQAVKPPKGNDPYLRALVAMPNGILAGFVDNFVAFCDPYHPYAWPVEYQITTETPIVGLGVFGQSLFVGTRGNPYVISGADSASMSATKLPQLLPCASARSIAGVGDGVIYASNDGLVMVTAAGAQLVTAALYAREDWQALRPETVSAIEYEGVYYFWAADGVCRALDFAASKLVTVDLPDVTALRRDELTDALFAVAGNKVLRCFGQGRRVGRWRTGVQTFPKQASLAWGVVLGDQSVERPATLRWYGDGVLCHERVVTDIVPFRLPARRPLEHEVEIESVARITRVQLASSTAELQEM